ncbi:hypothetical protein ABB37_00486 [Leptomonas pyrrhocoris]|uniref:Uncharacterized protein n=1 Tax=Leptomonas pyrrhocoris TaxID=157538 RepID=A0A0M9GAU5_LEPPY|nr:hypothetical protein ABB37_00486 [Leptomonas pyrrhocoris]KPA86256.1 hypothetical protein ABB37_00486 [Leptomonas pyrrhocoris]|eukprot:XP_015664695.1 hypothetical protein ABB37_00486 [Leptomonas pyrrhocoris]
MSESMNPSLLSEYYPTSSSSLQQHTYLRVLWLPLPVCFLWSGEALTASNAITSPSGPSPSSGTGSFSALNRSGCGGPPNASVGCSSSSDRRAEAFVDRDETVGGYEVALRRCLTAHPPVPATQLNWDAFSPSVLKSITALGKTANTPVELPFFLTSDLGTSHWENMDGHRATVAVLVVVSAAVLSVSVGHAVDVVQTIFTSQFKDKVCRCIVVDPPAKLAERLAGLPRFICVSVAVPVEQTAKTILLDVAQAVVNAHGAALSSYSQPDKADNTLVRTPVDKPNTFASSRTATTIAASRFKKKAADILLQCGAVTAAVAAYGETQFGSSVDCLWCSATVESIAAARYHYLRTTLLRHRATLDATVVQLQSDDPPWGPDLTAAVEELGIMVTQYGDSLKLTLSSLKNSSVPHSMQARLTRDIDENVATQITLLKGLLVRVRVCLEAKTWDVPSDTQSYRLGSDVRRCVETVFRLAYAEVDLYLCESLRQLSKSAPSGGLWPSSSPPLLLGSTSSSGGPPSPTVAMLRKRELETRFKRLEVLAARELRQPFLEELSLLRRSISGGYGAEWSERSLPFFAYLCMVNGAERRARALLVEMASLRTRLQLVEDAADLLLRVCALAGLGLPLAGLNAAMVTDVATVEKGNVVAAMRSRDPLCRLSRLAAEREAALASVIGNGSAPNVSITASPFNLFSAVEEDTPDRGVARLSQSISNAALLNVPLLLELMELFGRMGPPTATAALRCHLATLLLFQHPHLLDKATQRTLMSIVEGTSGLLEPQLPVTIVPSPFFLAWEALPLPPHLAPKTVPVGGALFTFIDTQRLKLTILCLNGKVLGSRTVWTVGDVASVLVTLYNPFVEPLVFAALALRCHVELETELDTEGPCAVTSTTAGTSKTAGAAALSEPICYVLSHVEVSPLSKRKVLLHVQPTQEGTLVIDGVALRLSKMRSFQPIVGQLPAPMHIPVLQRLPQVSCTLNTSELEIFGSQRIDFTVRVVNCGSVPISCISLTAHSEQCQLEGCEGCKERRNDTDTTVTLNKRALDAASRVPLQPGDVVMIPGLLEAPLTIAKFGAHHILFRTDLSLPHPEPEKPPNVPGAVPIYAVIPRRVTETRMRLFHSPGLVVTSVTLTKDRRAVEVRVANRSRLYSMELQLSALTFSDLPDAFIVAGAEYVVPPIKLTRILPSKEKNGLRFSVPWVVRELPHCAGTLDLDLSVVGAEEVSTEPLDECVLTLDITVPHTPLFPSAHHLSSPSVASLDHANDAAHEVLTYRWSTGGDLYYGGDTGSAVFSCSRIPVLASAETWGAGGTHVNSALHSPTSANGLPERRITASAGDAAAVAAVALDFPSPAPSNSAYVSRRSESFEVATHASTTNAQVLQRNKTLMPLSNGHMNGDGVNTASAKVDIIVPAVTPIHLHLRVAAPRWRRAIPLHVRVSIDSHFDVAVLSGAVEAEAMVGEEGTAVYVREFELFAFKTGKHLLHVTITDGAGRELTNTVQLIVEHSRTP